MFSLIASVAACSCEKGWGCDVEGGYQFEIPTTLYPALDTFQIGDTIHIQNDFSDRVYDRNSQQFFDLKSFDFYPITDIYRIDTPVSKWGPGTGNHAIFEFDVIIPDGYDYDIFQYSYGAKSLLGEFKYEEGKYKLDIMLIPNRDGLYTIRHFSRLVSLKANEVQDFPGRCSDERVEGYTVLNNNSDNNRDLLLDSPDTLWSKIAYSNPIDYEKFGGYTFYVIE